MWQYFSIQLAKVKLLELISFTKQLVLFRSQMVNLDFHTFMIAIYDSVRDWYICP